MRSQKYADKKKATLLTINFPSQDLHPSTQALFDAFYSCKELLLEKGKGYASPSDQYRNFTEADVVRAGMVTPIQYAWSLSSKHRDAMTQLLASQTPEQYEDRGGDAMLNEYAKDIANYCFLILGMHAMGEGYEVVKK